MAVWLFPILALWKVGVHSQHAHTTPTPNSLAAKNAFGRLQCYMNDLNSRLSISELSESLFLSCISWVLTMLRGAFPLWSSSQVSSMCFLFLELWSVLLCVLFSSFFFLPFCAFSLCLFCRLICQSFLFELGPWRTMMETTKARSPNLIWHLRSLDDYIRMCTESSMLTSASYCHWWESEKSILALHVLDPSLISHRLLQGN